MNGFFHTHSVIVGAKRIVIIVVVGLGILTWVSSAGWGSGGVPQPIAFPHKTHLDLKLPCTGCHQSAEKGAVAGRPPTSLCMACHAGGDTKSAGIIKLGSYGGKGGG